MLLIILEANDWHIATGETDVSCAGSFATHAKDTADRCSQRDTGRYQATHSDRRLHRATHTPLTRTWRKVINMCRNLVFKKKAWHIFRRVKLEKVWVGAHKSDFLTHISVFTDTISRGLVSTNVGQSSSTIVSEGIYLRGSLLPSNLGNTNTCPSAYRCLHGHRAVSTWLKHTNQHGSPYISSIHPSLTAMQGFGLSPQACYNHQPWKSTCLNTNMGKWSADTHKWNLQGLYTCETFSFFFLRLLFTTTYSTGKTMWV